MIWQCLNLPAPVPWSMTPEDPLDCWHELSVVRIVNSMTHPLPALVFQRISRGFLISSLFFSWPPLLSHPNPSTAPGSAYRYRGGVMGRSPTNEWDRNRWRVKAVYLTLLYSSAGVHQGCRQPYRTCAAKPARTLVTLWHGSIAILWTSPRLPRHYQAVPKLSHHLHRLPYLVVVDIVLIGWAIDLLSSAAF